MAIKKKSTATGGVSEEAELSENPERRAPCAILIDTSGSMQRDINELNEAMPLYKEEVERDPLARKRIVTTVIRFGGNVEFLCEAAPTERLSIPKLSASGNTPMYEAIIAAHESLEAQVGTIKNHGLGHYCPLVFLISDGYPTDHEKRGAALSKIKMHSKWTLFGIGLNADAATALRQIVPDPHTHVFEMRPGCFAELFRWISGSMTPVANSAPAPFPGDQVDVDLPSPEPWAKLTISV